MPPALDAAPQVHAVIDPDHPEAGDGGVVPPVETRWKPGQSGNPGGKPKGFDPRAVLRRKLAENPNEHGEGALAVAIAERALDLAESLRSEDKEGAEVALKAFNAQLAVIHEVSGKPQERVEHSGEMRRHVTVRSHDGAKPPAPLPGTEAAT